MKPTFPSSYCPYSVPDPVFHRWEATCRKGSGFVLTDIIILFPSFLCEMKMYSNEHSESCDETEMMLRLYRWVTVLSSRFSLNAFHFTMTTWAKITTHWIVTFRSQWVFLVKILSWYEHIWNSFLLFPAYPSPPASLWCWIFQKQTSNLWKHSDL